MNKDPVSSPVIKRLLRSTISNYIGRFVGLIIWFFLTPFILHQLEESLYGLWVLVGSVMAYGSLLDFGIAGAVTKYIAEFKVKGQLKEARALVATALTLYTIIFLLITIASIAISPVFPKLFNISSEYAHTATWLVKLSGLGMGLTILSACTIAILRGLQRFDLMNLISVIHTIILAVATVIILSWGGGVIGLVVVSIVVNLLVQIPAVFFIYRIAPELRFGLTLPNWELFRKVTTFSSALFILNVGGHLETKTDEIVIGAFSPTSTITPYNLARRLSDLPQRISEQFLSLLLPIASGLYAKNDQARLRFLYLTSTRLTIATFLTIGISLVILARPFLGIWAGKEFAPYSHLVFILALASLIDTSQWPASFVLQGIERHRFISVMAICSGLANLCLSVILIHRLGLTGVALGTLIPTSIISIGLVMPYTMRVIGVKVQEIYKLILFPVFVPLIPASLVTFLLRDISQPDSILLILLIAAAGALVYIIGYLRLVADEFEWVVLREVAKNITVYARHIWNQYKHKSD